MKTRSTTGYAPVQQGQLYYETSGQDSGLVLDFLKGIS
jgi:hypothetical protein